MTCFSFQGKVNVAGRDVSLEPGVCVSVRLVKIYQFSMIWKLHLPGCFFFLGAILYHEYGRLLSPSSVYCISEVLSYLIWVFFLGLLLVYVGCCISGIP